MADDYQPPANYNSDLDQIEPNPPSAEGPNGQGVESYQAGYDPGPQEEQLPQRLQGGIDRLRSRYDRKINDLQNNMYTKGALYRTPDGLSYEQPTLGGAGYRQDIQGNIMPNTDYGYVPVQQEQINLIKNKTAAMTLPDGSALSDQHIYAQAPRIYQDLLRFNGGKPLDGNSFVNSQYWDQFKGMDNDMLSAVQSTVLNAIRPIDKQYRVTSNLRQQIDNTIKDPDNPYGNFFFNQLTPETKTEIGNVLSGRSRNVRFAEGVIRGIQEKKEALSDPDMEDAFSKLAQSPDPHDKAIFNSLKLTHSGSAFNNQLSRWMDNQAKEVQKTTKIADDTFAQFQDIPGVKAQAIGEGFRQYIIDGGFKGNEHLANFYAKKILDSMDTVKLPDRVMSDGSVVPGPEVPGIKMQSDEGKLVKKLKQMSEEQPLDKLYINPMHHVFTEDQANTHALQEINTLYPDSKIKGMGEYVKLPVDKFQDQTGGQVFLDYPVASVIGGETKKSLATFTHGDFQWVKRDALQKYMQGSGVSEDDLKNEGPIVIPDNRKDWMKTGADAYQPKMIRADQFMNGPEGQRFETDKGYYAALQQFNGIKAKEQTQAAWLSKPPNDPSALGEYSKAMAQTLGVALGRVGFLEKNIPTLVGSAFKWATGDTDGASKMWDEAVHGENGIKNTYFDPQLEDDLKQANILGYVDMKKFAENPNADKYQKVAAWGGHLSGELTKMAIEMMVGNELGAGATASKLGSTATKLFGYQKQLETLMETAGSASEIAQTYRKMAIVNNMAHGAVTMPMLGLMQGNTNPTDLAEMAGQGLVMGQLSRFQGFRMPFFGKATGNLITETEPGLYKTVATTTTDAPWYGDWRRHSLAALATAGQGGYDALRQYWDGKTPDEISQQLKSPEFWGNMLTSFAMNAHGQMQHEGRSAVTKPSEVAPTNLGEQTPSQPEFSFLKSPSMPDQKVTTPKLSEVVPPTSLNDLKIMQDRFMELFGKSKRSGKEEDEFNQIAQTLTQPNLNAWTKNELAVRGDYLAKVMNEGMENGIDPHPDHVAEFSEIVRRLRSENPGEGIFFPEVLAKEREVGPALWEEGQKALTTSYKPQLLLEGSSPEFKLLETQPQVPGSERSMVSRMPPEPLIDFINTNRDNPNLTYAESSKFQSYFRRIQDIYNSEEFNNLSKPIKNRIKNIVKDESLASKAFKGPVPESVVTTKSGVELDPKVIDAVSNVQKFHAILQDLTKKAFKSGTYKGRASGGAEKATERQETGYEKIPVKAINEVEPGTFEVPVTYRNSGTEIEVVKANSALDAKGEAEDRAKQKVESATQRFYESTGAAKQSLDPLKDVVMRDIDQHISDSHSKGSSYKDIYDSLTSKKESKTEQMEAFRNLAEFKSEKEGTSVKEAMKDLKDEIFSEENVNARIENSMKAESKAVGDELESIEDQARKDGC